MFEGNLGARRTPPSLSSNACLKYATVVAIGFVEIAGEPAAGVACASICSRTARDSASDAFFTRSGSFA